ncbi:hypothetical protein ACQPZG_04940 (plasmid) [Streptomyces sp. CA-294286]|uniref:hypothetical protein n=1 Tax=Streptomyces sp. CA-294286 TaxID=3240070 RepID=UPI003D9413CE
MEQDTLAQETEAGSAEPLALEHLDPVDMSCNTTGTPGRGKAGDNGGAVSVDVCGETAETEQVVLAPGSSHCGSRLTKRQLYGRPDSNYSTK